MQGSLSMGVTAPQVQGEVFPFKMQHFTLRNDLLVWALYLKTRHCKLLYLPIPLVLMGKSLRLRYSCASALAEMNREKLCTAFSQTGLGVQFYHRPGSCKFYTEDSGTWLEQRLRTSRSSLV